MKREEILEVLENLAKSQGFYGILLENIKNLSADDYDTVMEVFEDQDFKDAVDIVLFFET